MNPIQALFVGSIFISAFLLFLVQPLITKMLLPLFGGSPAVWNTALVFFQGLLLIGYLYAHLLARHARGPIQVWVHGAVLLVPLLLLPPALPAALDPSLSSWPAGVLLLSLTVAVGAPFLVLATNSSLVQHWWSRAGYAGSEDPYWLYSASNVGSLLALLAFPFIVEPAFALSTQLRLWSLGYASFVAITVGAMLVVLRRSNVLAATRPGAGHDAAAALPRARVLLWVARAAVGTSLLLSINMRISTDVASVPLFWVLTLAIYLLTYILAFGMAERLPRPAIVAAALLGVAVSFGLLLAPRTFTLPTLGGVSLWTLFFGALLCHRDLAVDRPEARHLTAFYLWIAIGGALGGVLNSLVAPVVFESVAEFPLTLIALTLLVYAEPGRERRAEWWRPGFALGVACAAGLVLPEALVGASVGELRPGLWPILGLATLASGFAVSRYRGLMAAFTVIVGAAYLAGISEARVLVAQERSFFGVSRVLLTEDAIQMVHGTTIHGTQSRNPELRMTPSAYYHAEGPIGSAVLAQDSAAVIGVVGLGAGAVSGLGTPAQSFIFYEIDPVVVDMANAHFSYLSDARSDTRVVLGDGRLSLAAVPQSTHDLILVDAFSSDFVPAHLLTTEALQLYLSRVKPDGLVLLHISNRHVDLRRVIKGFSESTGIPVAVADYDPSPAAAEEDAYRAVVAAIATDPSVMAGLLSHPMWKPIPESVPAVVWTDQRTDLLSVLW